jgi:hypothetical protein
MPGSDTTASTKGGRRDDEPKQAAKPTTLPGHLDQGGQQVRTTTFGMRIRRNQEIILKTINGQCRHICRVLPVEMKVDYHIDRAPWQTRVYMETEGVCNLSYTEMKTDDLDNIEDWSLFDGVTNSTKGRGFVDYEGHTKALVISSDTPFTCRTSTLIKKAEHDKPVTPTHATSQ